MYEYIFQLTIIVEQSLRSSSAADTVQESETTIDHIRCPCEDIKTRQRSDGHIYDLTTTLAISFKRTISTLLLESRALSLLGGIRGVVHPRH
jgi:hypothetical protein